MLLLDVAHIESAANRPAEAEHMIGVEIDRL